MCGICGSTAQNSAAAVALMNAAQVHRGPDDEGAYEDPKGRISLGARRLSIIDIARGHQPLSNEDGSIWAILNGEIYNSPALQERLRGRGHTFKSRSDTETLVHLYEEYEDDLVHALEGMFAFAVWDERRGRLVTCHSPLVTALRVTRVGDEAQQPEKGAQHVLALGDPRDGFHMERMPREQRRHERAPPVAAGRGTQKCKQQQSVGDVEKDVH